MRGDSLRDLYAKVIAVVGLGVLAGAGALVDYWPSGGALPRVAIEQSGPALAVPLPVPAVASVAEPRRLDVVRTARIQSPGVETVRVSAAVKVDPGPSNSLPVSHRIDLTRSSAAALAAPPVAPQPSVASPAQDQNDLTVSDVTANLFMNSPVRLSAVSVSEDDGEGFIVGAAKKTRDSIVRTGRKTGASIFDAFRFVGGAMKKALPGT
ncbi:MAG TPA: hypothetical protein VFV98_10620 [Vicinamibacterales bacterium]|nr:hypothetical protein [Vicinamibacterales bacterium]